MVSWLRSLEDEKATGGPGPENRPVTVEPELRHIEHLSRVRRGGGYLVPKKLPRGKISTQLGPLAKES